MGAFAEFAPHRHGTPAAVAVRVATVDDLPAVERVQDAAGQTLLLDGIRAAILDSGRQVLVAETGAAGDDERAAVVGWAKTHLHPRSDGVAPAGHYLGGVTVHPAWRRCGVATALTEARMGWIAGRAARAFYVVNARNTASIALHERWGFREVARAASFHGVTFAGGAGLLLAADLNAS
ncbi:ribosomal protein S18 acetylase RimI-like enzyme [Isoptericola sp. CG 20/1183]|uniref:Ribosomal protein S18 acetylase RimI-like enzyme n=1 Tax=Isoptericola halotolerans TaxID=300560 RepID=A0ABX5EHN0_9MICO|nr:MULTISPECIES: GNAT family N-acetyltransferase [Isoptericola]PRZ07026.1 ribosomal protein S18 acetylase RimI-like enzyme [Isoptericola halotolerans]PRZ07302.1 ribosomal protein S18 acetylase RimI-like enzyme [Isoptericola sp. CG 20/1183]